MPASDYAWDVRATPQQYAAEIASTCDWAALEAMPIPHRRMIDDHLARALAGRMLAMETKDQRNEFLVGIPEEIRATAKAFVLSWYKARKAKGSA